MRRPTPDEREVIADVVALIMMAVIVCVFFYFYLPLRDHGARVDAPPSVCRNEFGHRVDCEEQRP